MMLPKGQSVTTGCSDPSHCMASCPVQQMEAVGEAKCPGQMPNWTYSQRQRSPSEASWCLNPWMPQGSYLTPDPTWTCGAHALKEQCSQMVLGVRLCSTCTTPPCPCIQGDAFPGVLLTWGALGKSPHVLRGQSNRRAV